MSRDPNKRIQHWKDVEGHTYGKVLYENLTYDQALAKEKEVAESRGCHQEPGGPRNGTIDWAVYCVSGGTIK
jgi:hypothetical protein